MDLRQTGKRPRNETLDCGADPNKKVGPSTLTQRPVCTFDWKSVFTADNT